MVVYYLPTFKDDVFRVVDESSSTMERHSVKTAWFRPGFQDIPSSWMVTVVAVYQPVES